MDDEAPRQNTHRRGGDGHGTGLSPAVCEHLAELAPHSERCAGVSAGLGTLHLMRSAPPASCWQSHL